MSASSPEKTSAMASPSADPTSMLEEFVETTTTETAYSKLIAVEAEASDIFNTVPDNDAACAASSAAAKAEDSLAALGSPLVNHRRRAYGSASAAAPTDSLAETATATVTATATMASITTTSATASTTTTTTTTITPTEEESDGDQSGLLDYSEDEKESSIAGEEEDMSEDEDDKSVAHTKEKKTSSNEEEENVMDEDEDGNETGDTSDSLKETKEHVAPEDSDDSEDDEPDDTLETQPAPEASSAGRTKKTRQELSEASASKKAVVIETASTTESPAPVATTTATETDVTADQNKENTPNILPDEDAIIASTDNLYTQVDDKESVTLKDFFSSLTAEYGCKLDKPTKALVRQRLTDLISGDAQPSVDKDNVSDVGDVESESEAEDEGEEEEEKEEQQSDYDDGSGDDEASVGKKKKPKSTPKKRRKASSTTQKSRPPSRRKKNSKTLAVRVHADKLRKRRMEELRVRNEELQLHQSEEDQKRSELIAAKFETNTDELRVQRLEQRLDLLQKLDQRRTTVMQHGRAAVKQEPVDATEKDVKMVVAEPEKEVPVQEASADSEESESERDSDDDMELEFVGEGKAKFAPFSLQHTKPNHALSILAMADRVGGKAKQPKKQASPGRSMNARASLRNQLQAKQRKMGNMWLARELGYKNEEEHLRDCMQVENKKMEMTMKKEEVRLQANERKQLRLRLLKQSEYIEQEENDDDGEEEFAPNQDDEQDSASVGDEDDEEMQMAKAIEKEQADDAGDDPSAAGDDESPTNTEFESGTNDEGPEASDEAEGDDQLETQAPFVSFLNTESSEAREVSPSLDINPTRISLSPAGEGANKTVSKVVLTANTATDEADGSNDLEDSDDDAEFEMTDESEPSSKEEPAEDKPKGPRNSAWKAMLQKDAENAKKMKKRKNGLVEEEADEEEEEEVAGLEDFGFSVHKKKADDDEDGDDELDEDDLEHVVDDVSDNEGDEEEGEKARQKMARKEEKERHKEMIRRMRDGYDGRRGGIAGGGAGARGIHRFDQLVAADNREDAKRLGLLNDDEDDSDQEGGDKADADDEDNEALLLDKMLKDRFLHRSSVEDEENFSDDEAEQEKEGEEGGGGGDGTEDNTEDKEQDLLAKRFAKRARMQRLLDAHGDDEEFSQAKLIDDDAAMKLELQKMKNGLVRKRTQSTQSRASSSSNSNVPADENTTKKQKTAGSFGGSFLSTGGSLAIALQANRHTKSRTSFMRGSSAGTQDTTASLQKSIAFNHVVFHATGDSQVSKSNGLSNSNSAFGRGSASAGAATTSNSSRARHPLPGKPRSKSLWSKAVVGGFQRRRSS